MATVDYAGNFGAFLADKPAGVPFCYWYGSIEPHRAYEYGSGIKKGNHATSEIPGVPGFWPDSDTVRTDLLDFAFELEYFDLHIRRMLNQLALRGELENTIVIVTADNGMPFPRAKGQSYEISNHIPLAIMWPKGIQNSGRKVNDFVSFIDVAPTLLACAGITEVQSRMQPITGRSMVDLFKNKKSSVQRDRILLGKERHDVGRPNDVGYPMRGIRKGNYLYVKNYETDRWPAGNPETGYLNVDGGATKTMILNMHRQQGKSTYWDLSFGKRPAEELYNLSTDRDCMINLALNKKFDTVRTSLRKELEQALDRQGDPRMSGKGYLFDQYPYADESGRDFYNRYIRGEKLNANWVSPTDFEQTNQE